MAGRDWARLLVLAAVWSGSFLCTEIALRDFGPLTIAAGRVALGAAFLGLWMSVRGTPFPLERWPAFLAMGLLNNAIPFSLVFWAQQTIESGLAAILNATTPLFAALLAAALGLERLPAIRLFGLIVGLGGVAVLIGPDAWEGADQTLAAEGAVLIATLFYASPDCSANAPSAAWRPMRPLAGCCWAARPCSFPPRSSLKLRGAWSPSPPAS